MYNESNSPQSDRKFFPDAVNDQLEEMQYNTSPQSSPKHKRASPTSSTATTDTNASVNNNNNNNSKIRPVEYRPVESEKRKSAMGDLPTSLLPPANNNSNNNNRMSTDYNYKRMSNASLPSPDNLPPRTSSLNNRSSSNSSALGSNHEVSRNSNTSSLTKDQRRSMAPTSSHAKKPSKICRKCGEPISGQFVRALNGAYHIDCFKCADCGALCSSKFFPIDAPQQEQEQGTKQVPLCEKDYFKRLELLCFVCDGALRGSYITALGRKYHVEHFTCSMCSTVFGPEDSYYEYQDSIYCHFHYSTLFASRCEGCQTSILKQFVEIYRSGREQQWHPECYMIFKFWNVKLSPEGADPSINPLRPLSESASAPLDKLTRGQVADHEHEVDTKVFRIWTVLCGYEEASAAFISDMLQTASGGRFTDSLAATAKLVAKIEVLFVAIDSVCALIDPIIRRDRELSNGEYSSYTKLGKEAKTLCKKVVGFMSLISKSREKSVKRMGITQELLNLVTSLAHYLKLLIRFGLSNSLQYDRQHLQGHAVDDLLDQIASHEKLPTTNPLANLGVSAMTSDHCFACDQSIEDRCARLGDRRWHLKCLQCSHCGLELGINPEDEELNLDEARWSSHTGKRVFCTVCAPSDARSGFMLVPKLKQFVYLLKIAVARLQLVLNAFDSRDSKRNAEEQAASSTTTTKQVSAESDMSQSEKGYMTTLTDIRRLRSTKLDQQVSESSHRARRSKILDMPDSEKAQMSKNDSTHSLSKPSPELADDEQTNTRNRIKIEDDSVSNNNNAQARLDRTTDLFKNEKSLTLDDIPRIVAAEQARELRPNAYRHQQRGATVAQDTPETRTVSTRKEGNRKFISELSTVEMFSVRHIAVLLMEKMLNGWFSLDELLELIEVKKTSSLWEKFGKAFGGSDKKKDKKKSGVFGVPLDVLVEKYGVDSTLGVGPGPLRIPAFIDDCISSMRQKDMSVEGVFRKNGNIRRLKDFSERIDKNPDKSGILSEESPVQLAALLKKFLRELPEPLMTSKLLKLWIAAQRIDDEQQRKKLLHLTCCLLPKTHRDVMEVLFFFLNWTASFSHVDEETGSKMDAHNLATVITPNILYIKDSNGASQTADSGDAYFLSIESINVLIEEQSAMAEVPAEVLAILQHTNLTQATNEITTKEIISRYEQFMKDDSAQAVVAAAAAAQAQSENHQSSNSSSSTTQTAVPPTTNMQQKPSTSSSATVRSSKLPEVDSMSTSGSRPAPIRVDTEYAQRVAHDHEMYTSIKRVSPTGGGAVTGTGTGTGNNNNNSPTTNSPSSPLAKQQ